MGVKNEFIIEQLSCDNLVLKNSENKNEPPICSISKDEIFFGKGVIKIKKIKEIKIKEIDRNMVSFDVNVNEDKNWNEYNKKNHPIRWRLGLIGKSKKKTIHIGITTRKPGEKILANFFLKLGIPVLYG